MRRPWVKFVLSLTLLANSALAEMPATNGAPSAAPPVQPSETLDRFLFESPPPYTGLLDFFSAPVQAREGIRLSQMIVAGSRRLQQEYQNGLGFYNFYTGQLNADFSTYANWAIDPEQAALAQIRKMKMPQTRARQERPLSDLEARQRAWTETCQRMGLPSSSGYSIVDQLRRTDPNLALETDALYRRLYYLYTVREYDQRVPDLPPPEKIRRALYDSIMNTRIANFLGMTKMSAKDKNKTLYWQSASGDSGEITLSQLANAKLTFLDQNQVTGRDVLYKEHSKWSFVSRYMRQFALSRAASDWKIANLYYRAPKSSASVQIMNVQIEWGSRKLTIPESNFVELLNLVRLDGSDDLQAGNRWTKRWVIEGAKRDEILADLSSYIAEVPDKTVEDLEVRLMSRVPKVTLGQALEYSTLTEEIRDNPRLLQQTPRSILEWSGLHYGPGYWRVREYAAQKLWRPGLKDVMAPPPDIERPKDKAQNKVLVKNEALEGQMAVERLRTDNQRALARAGRIAKVLGLTALISVLVPYLGYQAINMAASSELHLPNFWGSEQASKSKSTSDQDPEPKEANRPPAFKMDDQLEPYVVPGAADANGKQGSPSVIFSVTMSNGVPPTYFNLPNLKNIPRDVKENKDIHEPPSVHQITLDPYVKPDLIVDSFLPVIPTAQRLPILSFKGYQVSDLRIWDERGYEYEHFQVYQVPYNGMAYAKLKTSPQNGFMVDGKPKLPTFTYTVSYKKIQFTPPEDPAFLHLKDRQLAVENDEIERVGFKQLSSQIQTDQKLNPAPSVERVAQEFSDSGFYTFRKVNKPDHLFDDSPYGRYREFLLDGSLYMQCTGGNLILQDYFTRYFQHIDLSYADQITVEPITGFVRRPGEMTVASNTGHLHTLVARRDVPLSARELDGTPINMDPLAESRAKEHPLAPKPLEKKKSAPEKEESIPAALAAEAPTVQRPKSNLKADAPTMPKPTAEVTVVETKINFPVDYLERLVNATSFELDKLMAGSDFLNRHRDDLYSLPGIKSLQVARAVLRHHKNHTDPTTAFKEVLGAQTMRPPDRWTKEDRARVEMDFHRALQTSSANAAETLFNQQFQELTQFIWRLQRSDLPEEGYDYLYLLEQPFRQNVVQLAELLTQYPWISELRPMPLPKEIGKNCATILNPQNGNQQLPVAQ